MAADTGYTYTVSPKLWKTLLKFQLKLEHTYILFFEEYVRILTYSILAYVAYAFDSFFYPQWNTDNSFSL